MSALAIPNNRYPFSSRRLSEIELVRAVSRITWSASSSDAGFAEMAALLLRVPGLSGVRFELLKDGPRLDLSGVSAVAPIAASGESYGQVRVFFDPQSSVWQQTPVRLARYVGQQAGLLLHRLNLYQEREKSLSRLIGIQELIRRRKAIHRAASILSRQQNVSSSEAISLMLDYARRHRRSLVDIADSLTSIQGL